MILRLTAKWTVLIINGYSFDTDEIVNVLVFFWQLLPKSEQTQDKANTSITWRKSTFLL